MAFIATLIATLIAKGKKGAEVSGVSKLLIVNTNKVKVLNVFFAFIDNALVFTDKDKNCQQRIRIKSEFTMRTQPRKVQNWRKEIITRLKSCMINLRKNSPHFGSWEDNVESCWNKFLST